MWKILLPSFVIALALLTFTRSAVAQTQPTDALLRLRRLGNIEFSPATQLTVLDADSKSGESGKLNSWSGADLWVDIQYSTPVNSTLRVFAEEYPAGSGCEGTYHHLNGVSTFSVDAGEGRQRFALRWPGRSIHPADGFKEGFVKVYAQLNEQKAHPRFCFRFDYSATGFLNDNQ